MDPSKGGSEASSLGVDWPGRSEEGARRAAAGRGRRVIHTIHSEVGRNVTGPGELERATTTEQAQAAPPGHFLSHELESDCARFLEDVRTLVRRREELGATVRLSPQP